MDNYRLEADSQAWLVFVRVCFVAATVATTLGILFLPIDHWGKGYLGMGLLFTVGSTFSLAKTLRDQHEAKRLIKKIDDAQTEMVLREYGVKAPYVPAAETLRTPREP